MSLIEEHDGDLAPESCAAILGEVLSFIGTKMEPVPYGAVLRHVMDRFSAPEELVSLRVMSATLELCCVGLIQSNTFHSEPARGELWLRFEADTTVSPSKKLTSFVYGRVE